MAFRSIDGVRKCPLVLNIALILLAAVVLAGCSKGVGGTYVHEQKTPDGQTMALKLELKGGNKAVVTIGGPGGQTMPPVEGTWSVAGDKVTVLLPGNETDVYTIKDGDLVGNFMGDKLVLKKK